MADIELPDKSGTLLEMFGEKAFRAAAGARFPRLKAELNEMSGQVHAQVFVLAEAVRSALREGVTELPVEIFEVIAEVLSYPRVASDIENAVSTSFVTIAELEETEAGRQALRRMPRILREAVEVSKVRSKYMPAYRRLAPAALIVSVRSRHVPTLPVSAASPWETRSAQHGRPCGPACLPRPS